MAAIWSIDKILTSNNQDQRVVLSMEELEKLDLPDLLIALSLSEEDLEKKTIQELNEIYKNKRIKKSRKIMDKLRRRRRQFKSRIDAKNKRDRENAEEAMLREGLNQIKEILANFPGEEQMAQMRERTEFYKQECEHFEATGRMRYGYPDY